MGDSKIFKCGFDITDHLDILPRKAEYLSKDFIINQRDHQKGNNDLCVWNKYKPSFEETKSEEFREREIRRLLKTGVFAYISEEICWIPPQYYFALQYGKTGGEDLEFRLKRLMHVYFKIKARNNPNCKGTFTVKNRQDGETTMAISDAFWETFQMEDGQIAIQSKTRNDAINPCWKTMQTLWMNLPYWIKKDLCSDFDSGKNIAETMKFMREANEEKGIAARNILLAYYPAVYNAIDGKNNVRKLIYDEILKWVECNFGDAFNNSSKFIMPGFQRRGLFDMFSSPPEKISQSYKDGYELWKKSDPANRDITGTTESRIERWYSNPLHGIQGAYDKFGDADPNKIFDWIMAERKRQPKSKLLEEVRGFPLNEEEIWGSMESSDFWDNQKGIEQRKIYLIGARFKNEKTKEPKVVYGNLEWKDGVKDTEVVFRQADKESFDVKDARFSFSFLPPKFDSPLQNIYNPPHYIESCLGIDSVDKRYPGKKNSNVAMVNQKFMDLHETGIINCPTMIYSNRPNPVEIAYEDAIKAAVFNRSLVQVESLNLNIVNHFEDRGYMNWVLSRRGESKDSKIKGDAPSGKSAFIDEIVGLINAATNIPLTADDIYLLLMHWHLELLEDVSIFSKVDTHKNDLSMSWGQALLGVAKILHKKIKQNPELIRAFLENVLN